MSKYSLSIKFYPLLAGKKGDFYPLYCRITVNRKKAEFNTQEKITLAKWDEAKQRVKGNPETNAILADIEATIRTFNSNLSIQGKLVTAQLLRDLCTDRKKNQYSLLEYYARFLYEIEELKNDYSPRSVQKYKTIKVHLEDFLKSKNITSILLQDFDLQKFNELEHYLKTVSKLSINTTTKYLKQVKAVFNRAISFGYLERIPFQSFKFKNEQVQREFLTKEEVTLLEEFIPPTESLIRVKDFFLFSIFTGLRYSDVANLTNNNLSIDSNGRAWVNFTIIKTKKLMNIPLMDKAYYIVKKYKEESEIIGKLLPVISNQKINSYLKVLGLMAEIKKPLSYHMARHTFATTITLSNDVPIEIVSKILGHSDISTTQIYAKITNDYLSKTTDLLNEKLK